MDNLTAIQDRILCLLSDGKPHTLNEVRQCLWDDQSCDQTISKHVLRLQKMLRPRNEDIISRKNSKGSRVFIHVRVVPISL